MLDLCRLDHRVLVLLVPVMLLAVACSPRRESWEALLAAPDWEPVPCEQDETRAACVNRRWKELHIHVFLESLDPEDARTLCEMGRCLPDNTERGPWQLACHLFRKADRVAFDELLDPCVCESAGLLRYSVLFDEPYRLITDPPMASFLIPMERGACPFVRELREERHCAPPASNERCPPPEPDAWQYITR